MRNRGETAVALALAATIIGAGFASGREVLRFFSAFGALSYAGCVAAAVLIALLSMAMARVAGRSSACDLASLCSCSLGKWGGRAAAAVNGLLLAATSGAMLAAMGELSALALPIPYAYAIGLAASLAVALLLCARGVSVLARLGGALLCVCIVLYTLLLLGEGGETDAPPMIWRDGLRALPLAAAYAAMNVALACGMLCEIGQNRDTRSLIRIGLMLGGMLLALLLLVNRAILPHADALAGEALPVVRLARPFGAAGYWLCVAVLSLAVMSTLVALLRSLERMLGARLSIWVARALTAMLPLAFALAGFSSLVGAVYPLLGAVSALLILTILVKQIAKKP